MGKKSNSGKTGNPVLEPSPKKDNSPRVLQREKLKNPVLIRELNWTEKQKKFFEIALDKDTRLMFIDGPAGTAKTLLAVYTALRLLNDKRVSDVVYLRSAVESSDAHLGFLPGTTDEKMAAYNAPFWDKVEELLSFPDKKRLIDDNRVHCLPINHIRGLNWNAKAVILDEAQNSTQKELVTTLTRLGEFSRCFICADPKQTDLHVRSGGFQKICNLLEHNPQAKEFGIHVFRFTHEDIMRSKLVAFLAKELEKL